VKRWSQSKGPHGIKIELIAENPDFENIIVDPRRHEIMIEGLAVGLIRPGGL
jgi:repressor LexA